MMKNKSFRKGSSQKFPFPLPSFPRSLFLCFLAFLLTLLFIATPAFAAQIRLAWDPNTEPDLAGYRVYWGTASGSYGTPANAGTATTYTITGLTAGQTYQLAVKAYDSSNNESGFSNEVSGMATDPGSVTVATTIATNPSGLQIAVDGTTTPSPQTFNWAVGSSHTISVASPISGTAGTRYVFSSWSDGGSQTHTITAPSSSATYTASFTTQYSLTTSGSPTNGGTVSPAGTNWYNSGQGISLSATGSSGYAFSSWSGGLSGSTNPSTVTMNAAKTITANFSSPGVFTVNPATGLSASGNQGGSFSPSSVAFTLQNTGGTAINWTGSKTQGWVTLSAASGTLAAGASATVTTSINSNANSLTAGTYTDTITFTNSTNGTGNTTRPVSLSVTVATYAYTFATNPSGQQIVIDSVTYTAPQTFNWAAGSSHAISVSSPQGATSDTRYTFSSWSTGGAQSQTLTAPAANTTYTANFTTQYTLTTAASPTNGGSVSPAGSAWYNSGQNVTVTASPASGYNFSSWSGGLTGTTNPATLAMNGAKSITASFVTAGTFVVTPGTGLSASGNQGGSFSPSSVAFTLQNTGGSAITWTGSKTQGWVTLSAASGTLAAGASTTVTASINSTANSLTAGSYTDALTFTNSTNGNGTTSRSIGLTVATNTPVYTISTNPSGLQVIVDGASYTSPKTFTWTLETSHTLSVSSPLGGSAGIQHVFSSWTDGGAQAHSIKASADTTNYVATFTTQYSLTASSNPTNVGVTNPAGTTWHTKGQPLSLVASPNSGYTFSGWSGHLQGTTNPQSLTMDGPKSVTAIFTQAAGQATGKIHPSFGIFRTGSWYFDGNGNGGWDGSEIDIWVNAFGGFRDDIPVVGDWNGNGLINIGIYRNGQWYLDADGDGTFNDCSQDRCVKEFGGLRGDIPVAGDWTGDGKSKLGIYRSGQWFFDKNNNGVWDGCGIDTCIDAFGGLKDDIPVIGDWNQGGKDKIGIYRKGQWLLDLNGNGVWDGCEIDFCSAPFGGLHGDLPIVARHPKTF